MIYAGTFLDCNPAGMKQMVLSILGTLAEARLEPYQTSIMELFPEIFSSLALNVFLRKASS